MKNRRRYFYWIASSFAFLAMISSPAWAVSNEEELENTQKHIDEAQQKQSTLTEESDRLEKEMEMLQEKLVKAAQNLQKTESELTDAEQKLHILTDEAALKSDSLKIQQKHLSALIIAELSLSHTPPEAMLMMPAPPLDIVKAARALSMTSESIRQETQSLTLQLIELQKLKNKVAEHRDQLATVQSTLDRQHRELANQLADRAALQRKLGKQQKQLEDTLSRLAKKAADLRELIVGIRKEEEETDEGEPGRSKPSREYDNSHLRSFVRAKGHMRPPATGEILTAFGKPDSHNAASKGITIATRRGAQVVAPYDGEVVFTGPFLNYGRMIILRHSDDFHTLLAGLTKIDVKTGQFLLEGEPIGAMGESDNENKNGHALYIELRKDNQPVDPAPWIKGLNKRK